MPPGNPRPMSMNVSYYEEQEYIMVKSLGSEWFLRYKAFYEVKGDGGEACPRGTQS